LKQTTKKVTRSSVHCVIILIEFVFGQTLEHARTVSLIPTKGYLYNNS